MSIGVVEKVVGTVAVMAVVLGGGSYWTGRWIEQEFREGVDRAARHGAVTMSVAGPVTVSMVDYQRGVFGASARTDVVFLMPSEDESSGVTPVTMSIVHSVRHGPLPALTAAARVRSEMQLTEETVVQFNELFGGDPFGGKAPLVIDTVIGWGGEKRLRLASPKFEAVMKDQTRVSWGGLKSEIVVGSGLSHKKASFEMGGLSFIKNDDDIIRVEFVKLKLDAVRAKEFEFISTGTTSLDLGKLHFRGVADNGAVHGVEFENFRIVAAASMKDGALGTEVKFDADRVLLEGATKETVDRPRLTFLMENLDAGAYDAIMNAMQKTLYEEQEGEEVSGLDTILQEQSKILLLRKPSVSIKDASAHWPEGVVTGGFRIAYTGDGNIHPDSLPLSGLSGDLQLVVPRALMVRQMSLQVSEEVSDMLEDGEEADINIGKETQEQVDKQIAAMLKNGLFVEKGDTLTVNAQLEGGELSLNGRPQPLEMLLGLLPF